MNSMSAKPHLAVQLQQILNEAIPLTNAMSINVTHVDSNTVFIEAPVDNVNVNIHGTAFAGSIYNVCGLSAWGLVHIRLLTENIAAEVVMAKGEISYLAPVRNRIKASCQLDENEFQAFKDRLVEKGKARITIIVNAREKDQLQASLEAHIVAMTI